MNSNQNAVEFAEKNENTYIDGTSYSNTYIDGTSYSNTYIDGKSYIDTNKSDDPMLNEYDPYIGTYLYNIFYSRNKVDPELYNQNYTNRYNELKSMYCPKHWAPSIFAHKIRIPKTHNICPVTQASEDFWKMYHELEINKKLD
jgi:hypothetical protein